MDENNDANRMQEPVVTDGVAQFQHMLLRKHSKFTSRLEKKKKNNSTSEHFLVAFLQNCLDNEKMWK